MNSDLEKELAFLKELAHFTPDKVVSGEYEFSLNAISELLSLIGNPEKQLKIIHVAGTNGKGSTISFLSEILKYAGYRVGVFTSPALLRVTEQIRINGEEISECDFAAQLSMLRPIIEDMKNLGHKITTEFETITVAAFSYFLKQKCDFVIIECGLGGKSDATNVIPTPLLSVITSIGLDHTEILGDTLEKIAEEKSGIIKENGHTVVMNSTEDVLNVFRSKSLSVNNTLTVAPNDENLLSGINLSIKGKYQISNALLARECALLLRDLGIKIPDQAIIDGLSFASWPCRFEIIDMNIPFVIDGGHNVEGVRALCDSLKAQWPNNRFRFIVGILKDKAYQEIMDLVMPIADCFYVVTVPSPRALPSSELASYLSSKGAMAIPFDSINAAIDAALMDASDEDILCSFGSLYYVGLVREYVMPLAKRLTESAK